MISATDVTIRIASQLAKAVGDDADDYPDRSARLATLPARDYSASTADRKGGKLVNRPGAAT
jgi:hypothetical protein